MLEVQRLSKRTCCILSLHAPVFTETPGSLHRKMRPALWAQLCWTSPMWNFSLSLKNLWWQDILKKPSQQGTSKLLSQLQQKQLQYAPWLLHVHCVWPGSIPYPSLSSYHHFYIQSIITSLYIHAVRTVRSTTLGPTTFTPFLACE